MLRKLELPASRDRDRRKYIAYVVPEMKKFITEDVYEIIFRHFWHALFEPFAQKDKFRFRTEIFANVADGASLFFSFST